MLPAPEAEQADMLGLKESQAPRPLSPLSHSKHDLGCGGWSSKTDYHEATPTQLILVVPRGGQ